MRLLATLLLLATALPAVAADRPNVILLLIDDQGYGDIAALGNPVVKTPAGAAEVTLPAGPDTLKTTLTRRDGTSYDGNYVKVERLEDGERPAS